MAIDWSSLGWTPTQSFALPTESQIGRSLMADAGKGAEFKLAPTAQNLALLQSLGYGGQGFSQAPTSEETAGANLPMWSDDARNWLSGNGYNLGVAHDPNTSAGGRPEYFGLLNPSGQYVLGQSDPTMTISDTLMDQVTPFLMMAGPFLGAAGVIGQAAGAGGGMAGIAADGVSMGSSGLGTSGAGLSSAAGAGAGAGTGTLGTTNTGVTQLGSSWSPQSLGLTQPITPGVTASELASLSQALPGAVEAVEAGGAGAASGSNLVANNTNTFWDKLQSGATKGAVKGGITSAVKGENPLKGAAMGAVGGAIGGGISSIGDGSLGNAMSLDSNSNNMGLIQGGFDAPTDTNNVFNNLGSFGGGASSTGGNMGWTDWISGLGGSANTNDLGSFGDPESTYWGNGSGIDLSGVDMNGYGQGTYDLTPTDAGSGWDWNSILNGAKSGIGAISGAVGGGQNLAALIGAGLGAASGGKTNTATTQSQIDPRMAQYLYGSGFGDQNSLLGAAQNLWQQNKTGLNPTMQQGLDMQRAALTDPAYAQSYTQMRNLGNSLMSQPIAGNPFTTGQAPMPQAPQGLMQQPTMQAGGVGGLLGENDRMKALMARGRGLIG